MWILKGSEYTRDEIHHLYFGRPVPNLKGI